MNSAASTQSKQTRTFSLIAGLKRAIHNLHGCDPTWVASVPVKETFQGRTVWEGVVEVFDLIGHPEATRCYVWAHDMDYGKRRYVAVLHKSPADPSEEAVKAAIVQEQRERTGP